jgi:hypothetical protein
MSLTVTVHYHWDEAAMQTEALRPRGAHAALLAYEADPWPDEGGLPPAFATALAAGLCACGEVAGRWFEDPPPPATARFLSAPPASVFQRLRDALPVTEKTWPASLALTTDPATAMAFFDTGWWMQYQMVAVLPDGRDEPDPAILAALRSRRDWRDFTGLNQIRALCAPAVDGDAAMIACASRTGLEEILDILKHNMPDLQK